MFFIGSLLPSVVYCQAVPELIILQEEYSSCADEDTQVKIVITGIPPVSITYLYNDLVGNANSSIDTIFLELADTGIFIITGYSDCCSDYIPASDTILLNRYEAPGVSFSGGGFQCDITQVNPLIAHFVGTPPFILSCLINNIPETISTEESTYTFDYAYDFELITIQISDLYCIQEFIDTVYIRSGNIPAPEIEGDSTACVNAASTYSVDNDMYHDSWYIPGVSVDYIDAEGNGSVRITWLTPGEYTLTVKLIDTVSECESPETTLLVTVNESPVLDEGIDTTVCISVDEGLEISIPSVADNAIYWPTIDIHGPTVTIHEAGSFPYILTNTFGCCDTSVLIVNSNCSPELYVPEAFTPNGDQINDLLELFGEYENLDFSVYSPSGILLFKSTGDRDFWDGTSEGRELPEGSYYWHANYTNTDHAEINLSGVVTIIR